MSLCRLVCQSVSVSVKTVVLYDWVQHTAYRIIDNDSATAIIVLDSRRNVLDLQRRTFHKYEYMAKTIV